MRHSIPESIDDFKLDSDIEIEEEKYEIEDGNLSAKTKSENDAQNYFGLTRPSQLEEIDDDLVVSKCLKRQFESSSLEPPCVDLMKLLNDKNIALNDELISPFNFPSKG